jgi:hypothetical protein
LVVSVEKVRFFINWLTLYENSRTCYFDARRATPFMYHLSPSLFSISLATHPCVSLFLAQLFSLFTPSVSLFSKSCKWMANKQALIPHQNKIKMAATTKEFRRYKININAHPTRPHSITAPVTYCHNGSICFIRFQHCFKCFHAHTEQLKYRVYPELIFISACVLENRLKLLLKSIIYSFTSYTLNTL